MKFDTPATTNPIDQGKIVGRAHDRIEGPAKVSGVVPFAYEWHQPDVAYGVIHGSAIAKGRILNIDTRDAEAAPGVLGVVTYLNAGPLKKARAIKTSLLAGPEIEHFDQAIALVVAESFEQARDAATLVRVDYDRAPGKYDLAAEKDGAPPPPGGGPDTAVGDFAGGFAAAAVTVDQTYTTPDQSHAMMEPQATLAAWEGDKLTVWTSNQMIAWAVRDTAAILGIEKANVRVVSPYIGGGFGSKLWIRSDVLLAALAARQLKRPVKVAIMRSQLYNNTSHRSATIQRVRLGAGKDGRIDAIGHEVWAGNLPGGSFEGAAMQTRLLYRGEHRMTSHRQAHLDLPEAAAMRAPGEAVGLLALEIAMDELAEKLGMDPVQLRILNDVQYDPEKGPERPFSSRKLVECLTIGAERFGWSRRKPKPGQVRDGRWQIGMGMAVAFRDNVAMASAARIIVDGKGRVTVQTDMTDIGTGSYTVIAQTAAEMMGVPMDRVKVELGDSSFPVSAGSGGQWGGNSATAGVYSACVAMRNALAQKAGVNAEEAVFEDGYIKVGKRRVSLGDAAGRDGVSIEDGITFGDLGKRFALSTFGAHFCEVGVDNITGEIRVRRMGGAFAAGRILNPKSARSQVIGAMTMGVGAALMEELVVDKRFGYFVNHDMAEYQVPVHADIPHQDVFFVEELDDKSSPMKAKGVGELGICGAGAAVANAVYNACGVRIRDYPLTLDKVLAGMTTA